MVFSCKFYRVSISDDCKFYKPLSAIGYLVVRNSLRLRLLCSIVLIKCSRRFGNILMAQDPWFVTQVVIEYVAERMALGVKKFQLKREVEELLEGEIHVQDYEKLRLKARALLTEQGRLTTDERRDNALSIYETILADEHATNKDKLMAVSGLNDMMGIGAKFKDTSGTVEEKAEAIRQSLRETDASS